MIVRYFDGDNIAVISNANIIKMHISTNNNLYFVLPSNKNNIFKIKKTDDDSIYSLMLPIFKPLNNNQPLIFKSNNNENCLKIYYLKNTFILKFNLVDGNYLSFNSKDTEMFQLFNIMKYISITYQKMNALDYLSYQKVKKINNSFLN